jgi:hypothetical protein
VISLGDRREPIFHDDADRVEFWRILQPTDHEGWELDGDFTQPVSMNKHGVNPGPPLRTIRLAVGIYPGLYRLRPAMRFGLIFAGYAGIDPARENVPVTDLDRDRILKSIRDGFRSRGFEIDVI